MLECYAMNRAMNSEEMERFLRSLSYTDICQEFVGVPANEGVVNHGQSQQLNQIRPSFYQNNETVGDRVNFVHSESQSNSITVYKEVRQTSQGAGDKRKRTLFTPLQLTRMEEEFRRNMYVVGLKRWRLATELCLTEKQIKIWFQNRRMKLKREQVKSRCLKTGFPWY